MKPRAALKTPVAESERHTRRKLELVEKPEGKDAPRARPELLQKELQCCDRATD